MAIQTQGNSGVIDEVGGTTFRARHVHIKPLEHGALGHYRVNHRCALINAQAVNSRIFEMRNTHATNLIIPTRLVIKWLIFTAHTAILEQSIDCYKLTSFTVSSTTNTVTPTASIKRANMAAAPGGAAIRGLTVAGAAAGMTGFTSTKDGGSFFQLPAAEAIVAMAVGDTASRGPFIGDVFDDVNGTHPFVFAQNEGFLIEQRVVEGAAGGSSVYIDFSWAEVTAF
jgi:hypothetical protein